MYHGEERSQARKLAICVLLSGSQSLDTANGGSRAITSKQDRSHVAEGISPEESSAVSISNQHHSSQKQRHQVGKVDVGRHQQCPLQSHIQTLTEDLTGIQSVLNMVKSLQMSRYTLIFNIILFSWSLKYAHFHDDSSYVFKRTRWLLKDFFSSSTYMEHTWYRHAYIHTHLVHTWHSRMET